MCSENGLSTFWCTSCGRPIGEFSEGEILEMFSFDWYHVMCFDCEGRVADLHPAVVQELNPGDGLFVDDCLFVQPDMGWDYALLAKGPHVRERARALCLSSSTYLNNLPYLVLPGWVVGVKGEK